MKNKSAHSEARVMQFLKEYGFRLNERQKDALLRVDGPTLLLAVPGSGKTTVVICRLGYMINALGIDPQKILTLTFSRAAVKDLSDRYRRFFPNDQRIPRFSTIHSFALEVIRTYEKMKQRSAFDVLQDPSEVLRGLYLKLFKGVLGENDLSDIRSGITYAKNMMLTTDEIRKMAVGNIDFFELFEAYEKYKKSHRLMDFDDMLIYVYYLLKREAALLQHFQKTIRYIHLDEAQDTSKIQFELLYLIAEKRRNIFMVGDEDQSIYGFRGAFPRELLEFKQRYPDGKVLLMEKNYRSTQALVVAADHFIAHSAERYPKQMVTENAVGKPANYRIVNGLRAQYEYLLQCAENLSGETAVLYRNNESVIPLVDLFERAGKPYRLKEHNPLFFSHFLITDFKRIWAFAEDQTDFTLFKKIYFKVGSGLSKVNMAAAEQRHTVGRSVFDTLEQMPEIEQWQRKKLSDLKRALKKMLKLPGNKLMDCFLFDCGYMDHIEYRTKRGFGRENIEQKLNVLKLIADREARGEDVIRRLDELEHLMREKDLKHFVKTGDRPPLLFSTIHSAKGLEFDKVILIDAVDGEFPSQAALEKTPEGEKAYAEEMRLFYVAVTRAKKELEFVILKPRRFQKSCPVSRFIELYRGEKLTEPAKKTARKKSTLSDQPKWVRKQLSGKTKANGTKKSEKITVDWRPGMNIRHKVLGQGVIRSVDGYLAVVNFPGGDKKLDLSFCEKNRMIEKV